MLRIRRGEPGAAAASPGSLRRALAALCVTEIVSYGVIYYAFPVLAAQITAAAGWSRTAVTLVADQWGEGRYAVLNGVFNAPVTAAGAVAPFVGAGIAAAAGSYPAMFVILAAVAATGAAHAGTTPAAAVIPAAAGR